MTETQHDSDDILKTAARWRGEGRGVALATVVSTWGSSPRPAGSQLVVDDQSAFLGSVSGGCVEGAVVAEAIEVIADGKPRLLDFGVSDDDAWEVGLACGGKIRVYVERVASQETERALLDAVLAARAETLPAALATRLDDGVQALILSTGTEGDAALAKEISEAASQALADDRSGVVESAAGEVFIQVFNPPLRLIVVGAVHIAQVLAPMAGLAGWRVTVVDPRRAFASTARFPGVEIVSGWPDDVMPALAPDRRTAIVTLTHDPKIDDPALHAALKSEAFYIGSLGSRKTHAGRIERLEKAGFKQADHGRIHGPIGLALGGRSPAEIAIAILAQITQALHQGGAA